MLSSRLTNCCSSKAIIALILSTFVLLALIANLPISPTLKSEKNAEAMDDSIQISESPTEEYEIDQFDSDNSSASISFQIPDILYVRIQKTGSTSLQMILSNLGKTFDRYVNNRKFLRISEKELRNTLRGHLQIYTGHIFFQPFLLKEEFWQQKKKPLMISLVRKPFDQFYSQFRFRVENCHFKVHVNEIDKLACKFGYDFEAFSEYFCVNEVGKKELFCNQETQFLQGDKTNAMDIVKQYDLILVLERFQESLALLHALHGFPMRFLFELKLNENHHVPENRVKVTPELKEKLESSYLLPDQALYQTAVQVLDEKIASLTPQQLTKFHLHKEKQVLFQATCEKTCRGDLKVKNVGICDTCIDQVMLGET